MDGRYGLVPFLTTNYFPSRLPNIEVIYGEVIWGGLAIGPGYRANQLNAKSLGSLDVFIAGVRRINRRFLLGPVGTVCKRSMAFRRFEDQRMALGTDQDGTAGSWCSPPPTEAA